MLVIVRNGSQEERVRLDGIKEKRSRSGAEVAATVARICRDVENGGWDAVTSLSQMYDRAAPREISADELQSAYDRCAPELRQDMEHAARNIHDYQRRLLPKSAVWNSPDGAKVGQLVRPLRRVGMYVPGGTAAYPSSVLMNAVPAKAAGVEELVMVTPPTAFLRDEVLTAAKIAGVDKVFAVGGAQAIAALAYGAGPVPRVDKIVGPGNAYVTEAKRLLFGVIDIDMIAGPSEVLVLADDSADAGCVAADLLSQAEHDPLAACYLVTDSQGLAEAVGAELEKQLVTLTRAEIAGASIRDFGTAFVCADMEECVERANALAPEHLELIVREPMLLIEKIHSAGALFIGPWTPEPMGDYIAGPSHVLPTFGTARFFSPLSALSFVKYMSAIEYDRDSFLKTAESAARMAASEGLDAHERSLRKRMV